VRTPTSESRALYASFHVGRGVVGPITTLVISALF
jgi:hypothetical protein